MESLGIVRKLDAAGRITLPSEIRRHWGIEHNDGLEIVVDGDSIILSKYRPRCVFCGNTDSVSEYKDKHICQECRSSLGGKHDE